MERGSKRVGALVRYVGLGLPPVLVNNAAQWPRLELGKDANTAPFNQQRCVDGTNPKH